MSLNPVDAAYLVHRIARTHIVLTGSSIDDARESMHRRSHDAKEVFRAASAWDFPGAEEAGYAGPSSPAWRKCGFRFSPTGGLPGKRNHR